MAKKAAKMVLNGLFGLFVCFAIGYAVCMRVWPEETAAFVGYRFYTVVTGSMEPTIPTTSVVLTRCLKEGETPQPGQILTFKADRLGEEIVLTHYLREVKPDETGRVRFYTPGRKRRPVRRLRHLPGGPDRHVCAAHPVSRKDTGLFDQLERAFDVCDRGADFGGV